MKKVLFNKILVIVLMLSCLMGLLPSRAEAVTGYLNSGGTITYVDSSGANPVSSPPYADGYVVHTFTSGGTFTAGMSGNVTVLAVGGGGAGGGGYTGGAGGGGIVYNTSFPISPGNISVTVGSGGAAGSSQNGGNSVFSSLTAYGGGGAGVAGGCGGGPPMTYCGSANCIEAGKAGSQGGNGGSYKWLASALGSAAGGGGAGANGANSSKLGGSSDGGYGSYYSIDGNNTCYGGGGAGGYANNDTGGTKNGGAGGGGNAGRYHPVGVTFRGDPGTDTLGGGGGGGSYYSSTSYPGGAGGTGRVTIRCKYMDFCHVRSSSATNVTYTSATLNGVTDNTSYSSRGFVFDYSSHSQPENVAPNSAGYGTGSSHIYTENGSNLSGFLSGSVSLSGTGTIYYRSYAYNGSYEYSAEQSFTITDLSCDLSGFTIGATDVSSSGVTLYGSLTSMGGYTYLDVIYPYSSSVSCNFQYKDSSSSGWAADVNESSITSKTSTGTYVATLAGLTAGAKYKFRTKAVATIPYVMTYPFSSGTTTITVYGDEQYFSCMETATTTVPMKASWIYNVYPDGVTSENTTGIAWTASSGSLSDSYELVDADWRAPDDVDYIYTAGDGYKQSYTFDDYLAGTTITKVTVNTRVKRQSILDNVVLYYRSGSTDYDQGSLCSGTSAEYVDYPKVFGVNPVTGVAWTTSDITNMQWGVKKTGTGAQCFVSEMYVTVEPATINSLTTLTNASGFAYLNMDSLYDLGYCSGSTGDVDWSTTESLPFLPGSLVSWFYVPTIRMLGVS